MDATAGEELRLRLPEYGPDLAALAFGPPGGRRVLALHGWLDNAASFTGLAPYLPGLRLVALDLPGHGRSGHRATGDSYHFIDWPAAVFRAADSLGWERFSILGHSMGAGVATLAAAALPARVAALALIEGLAPLAAEPASAPDRLAAFLAAGARRRPPPVYPTEAEALAARLGAGEFQVPERMAGIVRRGLRAVPGGLSWASDSRLRLPSAFRFDHAQIAAFLARVACPTLLVRAAGGLLPDGAALDALIGLVPALEQVRLPGFHHLHVDDPEPVAAAVRRFLAGHPG